MKKDVKYPYMNMCTGEIHKSFKEALKTCFQLFFKYHCGIQSFNLRKGDF